MFRKCEGCDKLIAHPYIHCDACVMRLVRDSMARRRAVVTRSPEAASTLALTREDRAFLREMMVGCE